MVEKHFNISIAPVRSLGGSLVQNTYRFRGFKLTFADWLKFSLIEELTDEIDV
jgi:hypothetical protein